MFIGEKKYISKSCFDVVDIELSELPLDLQVVADKCGLDTVVELLKNLQGTSLYIPRVSRLKSFVCRYIKENITKSTREIALETNASENFIRNLKYELKISKKK